MNKKGSLISTGLMALSMILFLVSIFCFFGPLVNHPYGGYKDVSMWSFMFESSNPIPEVARLPGLSAIFAFQVIITALIILLVVSFVRRFNSVPLTIIIVVIIVISSIISIILSFNGVNLFEKVFDTVSDIKLGSGAIAYSVLHIIALVMLVFGGVLSRRGL